MSKKVLIAFAASLSLFLTACGEKKDAPPAGGGGGSAPTASSGGGAEVKLDPATAGTIKGSVKFANAPDPLPKPIDMGEKTAECGTKEKPKMQEFYIVGENNAAANVLVFVKNGPAKNVKSPVPTTEVLLDQHNCVYIPHVLAMRAGQPLRIKSEDPTSHNIHLQGNLNGDWNKTMNANSSFMAGDAGSRKIEFPEIINVKCDIHSWMGATIGAFAHDAFFVTQKDGMFELKNLPPGQYEIEVKHERAKAKPQTVTIGPKETKELKFELKFDE